MLEADSKKADLVKVSMLWYLQRYEMYMYVVDSNSKSMERI